MMDVWSFTRIKDFVVLMAAGGTSQATVAAIPCTNCARLPDTTIASPMAAFVALVLCVVVIWRATSKANKAEVEQVAPIRDCATAHETFDDAGSLLSNDDQLQVSASAKPKAEGGRGTARTREQ